MHGETRKRLLLSKWRGTDLREQLDAKEEEIASLVWERDELEIVVSEADVLDAWRPL